MNKLFEGRRSAIMSVCFIYNLLCLAACKIGVPADLCKDAMFYGSGAAALFFGGQSWTDHVEAKVAAEGTATATATVG